MVQFGTKLENNRVQEWAEFYLDYEALKTIIKKIKRMLESTTASTAAAVDAIGAMGGNNPSLIAPSDAVNPSSKITPRRSSISLTNNNGNSNVTPNESDKNGTGDASSVLRLKSSDSLRITRVESQGSDEEANENMPILQKQPSLYGSLNPALDLAIEMDEANDPDKPYLDRLILEAEKVDGFYLKKAEELRARLQHVKESVQTLRKRVKQKSFRERMPSSMNPGQGATAANESEGNDSEGNIRKTKSSEMRELDIDVEKDDINLPKYALSTESLSRSCNDIYRQMNYLQNFAVMNYTGFIKIIKKHDKVTKLKTPQPILKEINEKGFSDGKLIRDLIRDMEELYAGVFHHGNVLVARGDLLMKHRPASDWQMLHIGMRLGMVIVLLVWVLWDIIVQSGTDDPGQQLITGQVMTVYRGMASFVICFWLSAFTIYMWNTARVNYVLLFEVDTRYSMHYIEIIMKATTVTIFYLLNLLVYTKLVYGKFGTMVPPSIAPMLPLFLFIYMITNILFPWSQRGGIIAGIGSVMTSPFGEVTFFTSFVGDVLTSMVKPLVDFGFSICYFLSGEWRQTPIPGSLLQIFNQEQSADSLSFPFDNVMVKRNKTIVEDAAIELERSAYFGSTRGDNFSCLDDPVFKQVITPLIICLPLWFRIMQNFKRYYQTGKRFPHLANSLKYIFAFSVVLFGALHPVNFPPNIKLSSEQLTELGYYRIGWMTVAVISSVYAFSWDVYVDWGLGRKQEGYLRARLMYPNKWYYAAIIADFFLRFVWVITIIPSFANFFQISAGFSYLTAIVSWLELCRRSFWSIFRVENEHLYNTEGYRRVDFIPLHFEIPLEEKPENSASSLSKREIIAVVLELAIFFTIVVSIVVMAFTLSD